MDNDSQARADDAPLMGGDDDPMPPLVNNYNWDNGQTVWAAGAWSSGAWSAGAFCANCWNNGT